LFIHDLAVAQFLRGSGAAAALLSEALDVARRASLASVRLVSLSAATHFWIKHGFSLVVGERLPDDYGEAVFMQRAI
jgi:N-acetylglutamate synthase-like GNAT family acetyltransferase